MLVFEIVQRAFWLGAHVDVVAVADGLFVLLEQFHLPLQPLFLLHMMYFILMRSERLLGGPGELVLEILALRGRP